MSWPGIMGGDSGGGKNAALGVSSCGMRVALVRCLDLPEPDPDEAELLAAFARAGHEAAPLSWDDPSADPGAFDLCILRATWNYHRHLERFLAWLERARDASMLLNPLGLVRWNVHKRYLVELGERVRAIPTRVVPRGVAVDPFRLAGENGPWEEIVIKPAVSLGGERTRAFGPDQAGAAAAFLASITADGDAVVQRCMPAVRESGERCVVWFGGAVSHVVQRRPGFAPGTEGVSTAALRDDDEELCRKVLRVVTAVLPQPFYARIDLIDGDDGRPCLSEFEVVEPSLFFTQGSGSADRFVAALERTL